MKFLEYVDTYKQYIAGVLLVSKTSRNPETGIMIHQPASRLRRKPVRGEQKPGMFSKFENIKKHSRGVAPADHNKMDGEHCRIGCESKF